MAKLVDVSYGSKGENRKKLYTYVVNDNVKVGQFLNVAVTHRDSGTIYGTLAIAQQETPKGSKEEIEKIDELNTTTRTVKSPDGKIYTQVGVIPKKAYSAEEAGLRTAGRYGRDEKGRLVSMSGNLGFDTVKQDGKYVAKEGKQYKSNAFIEKLRQYNVEKNKNPQEMYDTYRENIRQVDTMQGSKTRETFDEYSKKYL